MVKSYWDKEMNWLYKIRRKIERSVLLEDHEGNELYYVLAHGLKLKTKMSVVHEARTKE